MNSIIDYFEKTVKSYPKKTALIYKDLTFTYQELHDIIMSKSMALNYLEKKSVVGIFMGNSSDFIISYLAVMKAGLIPHLIPLNLPTEKISDQIKNSKASLVIHSDETSKIINHLNCDKVNISELSSNKIINQDHVLKLNDIAYLIYTSGTTSSPKGVGITHSNSIFTTNNIIKKLTYKESDINLVPLPLSHSFGLGCLHVSLFVGSTFVLLDNASNIDLLINSIKKYDATTLAAVPTTLNKIIQQKNKNIENEFNNIRLIITNSTTIPTETVIEYKKILHDRKLVTYYGLTEASRSTFMIFDIPGKENSVGLPPKDVEIEINNDTKNPLDVGEILIKGPNVISNYWNNSKADELIKNSWLHTGDLGHKDSDGYLYLDGRTDYLINIAGEKIIPEDIEKVVKVLSGVEEAVAIGVKNEMFGHVIKLFVKKTNDSKIEKSEIISHCIKNLERYMVPREIQFVNDFPRNTFGKIERFSL